MGATAANPAGTRSARPERRGPTSCQVYQYLGADSAARQLVLTRYYQANGRVVAEHYRHYRLTPDYLASTGATRSRYRDTVLVERLDTDERGDQLKTRYFHDQLNRLRRVEQLTYERRQKKGVEKGNGRPGGCILVEADFRKRRSWEKSSVMTYAYDAQGRRIGTAAPKVSASSQNRYTWAYDSLGRVSQHRSYEQQRLIWREEFTYFAGGHRCTRTWYDAQAGSPSQLKPAQHGYWPQYTTTCYYNATSQLKWEETASEKGVLISRTQWSYNAQHQLVKTVYQNGQGEVKLTHVFSYQ